MHYHRTLLFAALPGLLGLGVSASAQGSPDEQLARQLDQMSRPATAWYLSIGARAVTAKTSARYSNLGSVASANSPADPSSGAVDRTYDNGYVTVDSLRTVETASDGTQGTTPGGRYQIVNSSGTVVADYVSYTPGVTRTWRYNRADQVTADGSGIDLSTYSASSEGGSAASEDNTPGYGVEIQLARVIGRSDSGRFEWMLGGSLGISKFSTSTSGQVTSTLTTTTDTYSLNGLSAPAIGSSGSYSGPSYVDLTDGSGNVVTTSGYESTTPLSDTPSSRTITTTAGGALVAGDWEVAGAYWALRLGPSCRAYLSDRWSLSAGGGFLATYVGARFESAEKLVRDDLTSSTVTSTEQGTAGGFAFGYYADARIEFWPSERTGLYVGATYEGISKDLSLEAGGRTAEFSLSTGLGVNAGVVLRF